MLNSQFNFILQILIDLSVKRIYSCKNIHLVKMKLLLEFGLLLCVLIKSIMNLFDSDASDLSEQFNMKNTLKKRYKENPKAFDHFFDFQCTKPNFVYEY